MRLLLNALQSGNRSGTGRYICELAQAFLDFEEEIELLCLCPDGALLPSPEAFQHFQRDPLSPTRRFLWEQWALPHTARKLDIPLLHYPAGTGLLYSRVPHILTIHDLCYLRHPEWFPRSRVQYYRMLMGRNATRAARIITDSHATAEDIVHFLSVPETCIDIIPLGVNSHFHPASDEALAQVRERYSLPDQYYLFVGTLEPRKNLTTLVRAWARLKKGLPDLVIAGRLGWHTATETLRDQCREKQHHIHFPGHVCQEDLPALYSGAVAFVYPSLMEGFGLPPLEAMACGTPVITSNTSSLPEVTGDAALLVDPENAEEMAQALEKVAENHGMRTSLIDKGMKRSAQFTWRQTALKTLETYQKVLGG